MEYLHQKRIVHFDLKSANLLLGYRDKRAICKVADFGLSKQKHDTYVTNVSSQRGTLPWTAPEIIKNPKMVTEKVLPLISPNPDLSKRVRLCQLVRGAYSVQSLPAKTQEAIGPQSRMKWLQVGMRSTIAGGGGCFTNYLSEMRDWKMRVCWEGGGSWLISEKRKSESVSR